MRKIEFRKVNVPLMMQAQDAEAKESGRTRTGYFHEWGTELTTDNHDQQVLITVGIVEDADSGKVYTIEPILIKFLDKPE